MCGRCGRIFVSSAHYAPGKGNSLHALLFGTGSRSPKGHDRKDVKVCTNRCCRLPPTAATPFSLRPPTQTPNPNGAKVSQNGPDDRTGPNAFALPVYVCMCMCVRKCSNHNRLRTRWFSATLHPSLLSSAGCLLSNASRLESYVQMRSPVRCAECGL